MVQNGEKWAKGTKIVKIAQNGLKLSRMVQNGNKWSKWSKIVQMVKNGPNGQKNVQKWRA